jgi:hypothetical protein
MLRTGFAVLLLLASTRIVAQFTLHGKIVNENGIALPGAGISFKETDRVIIRSQQALSAMKGIPKEFSLTAIRN